MTVRTHRFENGMRVVTESMPGLKSAALGIWVTTGCRHERPEQNGIAHFLEHMAFKGTKRRSSLDIAEAIENVGGYINAYTSREMTAYHARVLEADVPLALDVISDIVLNPVFDPKEIEIERGVILQEIGQSHDTPDDIIFDWLQETAFPEQPMGRPILGPSERVRAFGRDDFRSFVGEHYPPENLILSAAGAVDHDAIIAEAEKLFAGLKPAGNREIVAAEFAGGECRVEKDLEQAHFAFSLPAPGYGDDDVYTAQIQASILGGGMSSRLFQEIREKRGLCYTIFAHSEAFADAGMMTVYAGTSGADIGQLAEVTMDEIRRAADSITETEVERARTRMKAGMLMGLESPSSRCERQARSLAIWGRVQSLEETVAKIDAVDLAATRAYSERLCAGMPAMALYGPVADAPGIDQIAARLSA